MSYKFKPFNFFKNKKDIDSNAKNISQLKHREALHSKKEAELEAWSIAQNINA